MTINEARRRAARATIILTGTGGRGVLVPGGLILTAAHCLNWKGDASASMALDRHFFEAVQPKKGLAFRVSPAAVEPVADIAALGEADNQILPEDAMAFHQFCNTTEPVPVSTQDFRFERPVRVHFLTHKGRWARATLTRYGHRHDVPGASAVIEGNTRIEGGASGGPIIDDAGRLVGIVSVSGGREGSPPCDGRTPRPHLALPGWVARRIKRAMRK